MGNRNLLELADSHTSHTKPLLLPPHLVALQPPTVQPSNLPFREMPTHPGPRLRHNAKRTAGLAKMIFLISPVDYCVLGIPSVLVLFLYYIAMLSSRGRRHGWRRELLACLVPIVPSLTMHDSLTAMYVSFPLSFAILPALLLNSGSFIFISFFQPLSHSLLLSALCDWPL